MCGKIRKTRYGDLHFVCKSETLSPPSLRPFVKPKEQRLLRHRLRLLREHCHLLLVERSKLARQLHVLLQLRNGSAARGRYSARSPHNEQRCGRGPEEGLAPEEGGDLRRQTDQARRRRPGHRQPSELVHVHRV